MGHRQPPRIGRTCIFCGDRATSREHVVPDWLNEHWGDEVHEHRDLRSDPGHPQLPQQTVWSSRAIAGYEVRRVCRRICNNGWMAELEAEAKPLLLRLMPGEPATLSLAEQMVIARWAAKTAYVVEQLNPRTASSRPDQPPAARAGDDPPRDVVVWLGRRISGHGLEIARGSFLRHPGGIWVPRPARPEHPNGSITTVMLDELAVQCLVWSGAGPVPSEMLDATPARVRIWPTETETAMWPPDVPFDRDEWAMFVEGPARMHRSEVAWSPYDLDPWPPGFDRTSRVRR